MPVLATFVLLVGMEIIVIVITAVLSQHGLPTMQSLLEVMLREPQVAVGSSKEFDAFHKRIFKK